MSELPPDELSIAAGADPGRRKAAAHEARAAQARAVTREQRDADVAAAQEFNQIKKFSAAMPATMAGRDDRAAAGRRANKMSAFVGAMVEEVTNRAN
jgi:hypothetical protein